VGRAGGRLGDEHAFVDDEAGRHDEEDQQQEDQIDHRGQAKLPHPRGASAVGLGM